MTALGPLLPGREDVTAPARRSRASAARQVVTTLRELVRRRGRQVTKEDLFHACWPNTAVSQTVLRVCISEIRAVLAEDVTGSTSIESVGRRGYRLVAQAGDLETAWMTQGGPQDPSDAQLHAIKDRQGLELLETEREEAILDSTLALRIPFPLPSVSLIEIRPLS